MVERLRTAKPRQVSSFDCRQWYFYTDACYEPESSSGGLGGVLVDEGANVCEWFGIALLALF